MRTAIDEARIASGDSLDRVGPSAGTSAVDVRQLRAFLAIVEHGSVSAAALALGLAQSTVSEALAALDRAVGSATILRKRGAHAVVLTEAGEALLPHATRVLEEIDALHSSMARVTRSAHGQIHIMSNESVSTYVLAPALATLRKRWPKVRFTVSVGTCANIRSAVATAQCDVGVLLEEDSRADDGGAIVLARELPLVIFGNPEHALVRRGGTLRPEMLGAFPLYIADGVGVFHDIVRRYVTVDGLPGPRLESIGSIEGVKRAVDADGVALGLLPLYAITDELRTRRVQPLMLDPAPPRMALVARFSETPRRNHPVMPELIEQMRR